MHRVWSSNCTRTYLVQLELTPAETGLLTSTRREPIHGGSIQASMPSKVDLEQTYSCR